MNESNLIYPTANDNPGNEGRILYMQPLKISSGKVGVLSFISLITCGISLLFIWWFIELRRLFIYSFCDIKEATRVLVVGEGNFNVDAR
jgi:hypothetical protein